MNEAYTIKVTVRKRNDLEQPTNMQEAIYMVSSLLDRGKFLEIVDVVPEEENT
jgi:hypothetical protein